MLYMNNMWKICVYGYEYVKRGLKNTINFNKFFKLLQVFGRYK